MSPATLPPALRLGPLQQWQYFSEPRATEAWLRERFGEVAPIYFQGHDSVLVLTSEGARQVFSADPDGYEALQKDSLAGLSGDGTLWVLDGDEHRRERQLFAPAVHASYLGKQGETIRAITRQHIDKWQPGQTIRAIDTTLDISLDVIMRLVFGVEEGELMGEGHAVLAGLTRNVHPLLVIFPWLQRPWFPLWWRFARARDRCTIWANRLLVVRRARNTYGDDVLGRLLAAQDIDGHPVSDAHILNELMLILASGHQTTGEALALAIYELSRHPEVVSKLRAELESAEANPTDVLKLPYVSAVCNETLRLHSIAPHTGRLLLAPLEILGYAIPAGHALVISIVGIHHDPTLYPEPDAFKPERFIERKYSVYEFLPYGGGHRRCPGAVLADYELRIAVAEIVQRWDFEPAAVDYDIRQDLTMGPKYGVRVRIKARQQAGRAVTHSAVRGASVPV